MANKEYSSELSLLYPVGDDTKHLTDVISQEVQLLGLAPSIPDAPLLQSESVNAEEEIVVFMNKYPKSEFLGEQVVIKNNGELTKTVEALIKGVSNPAIAREFEVDLDTGAMTEKLIAIFPDDEISGVKPGVKLKEIKSRQLRGHAEIHFAAD